jgi:hypothetical protein
LLGVGMMFTCHDCDLKGVRYKTYEELREHRHVAHTDDFVNGVPFWALEVRLYEQEYYWIARQTHDKTWLKWANSKRA